MSRLALLVFGLALSSAACKKADNQPAKKPAATTASGTVVDGVRKIAIEANKEGYTPDRIPGKPGEKLVLVFTRTFDSECIGQLKTPEGKLVPLPMNKPVEVAVTVPADGEVTFACGMDMFHGVVVADKAAAPPG
ncbi:MAG: Lead, cadmium, zinc and mercury transporting ATPase [Deltaproteobacteria bacterium]|nr:Lead, cadmium, zinc and mercury transporting ATPase [Deltaproteobacteria bacterium]